MIERPPNCAATSSTASRTASTSPTSTARPIPPISAATASAASPFTSKTATRAPSSAIRRQAARPIPDPPPVTIALLPSSRPIVTLHRTLQPRRRLEDQRRLELPDQQLLRHAQVQGAVLTVHRRPDGGAATRIHQRMDVEETPHVGPPRTV